MVRTAFLFSRLPLLRLRSRLCGMLIAACALLMGSPALAAPEDGTAPDGAEAQEDPERCAAETADEGFFNTVRCIDMPPLLVPMITGNRLHYYYFLNIRLRVRAGAARSIREMVPLIQDGFVDMGHSLKLAVDGDPKNFDKQQMANRLLETAQARVGADKVLGVEIIGVVRGLP